MVKIDIEMPNSCSECPLYKATTDDFYNFSCALLEHEYVFVGYTVERHADCPLIEDC